MRVFRSAKKILLATLLSSMPILSVAGWDVEGVYVKKVDMFYSGATIVRVIYELVPGVSNKVQFNCGPNDTAIAGYPSHYQASYWYNTDKFHQMLLGQLLAAQAQGVPVDLFFDASGCNTDSTMGHGGLGRKMHGASVISE